LKQPERRIAYREPLICITVGFLSETWRPEGNDTTLFKLGRKRTVNCKSHIQRKYPSRMKGK
jgi:hypothetical protein